MKAFPIYDHKSAVFLLIQFLEHEAATTQLRDIPATNTEASTSLQSVIFYKVSSHEKQSYLIIPLRNLLKRWWIARKYILCGIPNMLVAA